MITKNITFEFKNDELPPVGTYCLVELIDGNKPYIRFDVDKVVKLGRKSDGETRTWGRFYPHNVISWAILE